MCKKNKIFWIDKEGKFIWKYCPRCRELTVEAKNPEYIPTEDDKKHIRELTKALVFPCKFDRFAKKCDPKRWSNHILVK